MLVQPRSSLTRSWVSCVCFFFSEDQIPHGFPTIDMGPQLKVVERTRTATMLCAASGNPDPEIHWFKDFLPVDINSSNGRIKQLRSGRCSPPGELSAPETAVCGPSGTLESVFSLNGRTLNPMSTVYTHQSEYQPGSLIENVCLPGVVPNSCKYGSPKHAHLSVSGWDT